ncbi:hypothetical protein ABW21_db0206205 [Orbilia brochopaga]|nr:hypothetical protein ABW21_db0206205 [Drechslerella brochopaga]
MLLIKSLALGLGIVGSASAAVVNLHARASLVCNADNCLRAVRAAQPVTRLAEASADCSSYMGLGGLAAVAEPTTSTVTVTVTASFSETSTSTLESTSTVEVHVIATSTVQNADTLTVTSPPPSLATPFKRRDEVSQLPSWAAGPCSVASRFTSACACIGVTSLPAIDVPPPQQVVTTVTVTVSETASFVATVTSVTDVSVTVTDSTTTVTQAAATSSILAFKLSVAYPPEANKPTEYVNCDTSMEGGACFMKETIGDATTFYMPSTGGTLATHDQWQQEVGGYPDTVSFLEILPPDVWSEIGGESVKCSIDSSNKVTCAFGGSYSTTNILGSVNYEGTTDPGDYNDYLLLVNSDIADETFGEKDGYKAYSITLTAIPA